MKSTKILTLNPQPSGVNQKLVPAKKYNELWDDVKRIDLKEIPVSSIIKDKGLGDGAIAITTTNISVSLIGDELSASGAIFMADVLQSVHYTGTNALIYYMKLGAFPFYFSSENINEVFFPVNLLNVGSQTVTVKVGDGVIESNAVAVSVIVEYPA